MWTERDFLISGNQAIVLMAQNDFCFLSHCKELSPLNLPGGCSERLGVQVALDVADGVHHGSVCGCCLLKSH